MECKKIKIGDKYRIDSHKLMYHVPRVNDWLNGKTIYPVYMEVSPSGACNHRCTFCALDFMEYQKRYLNASVFKDRLSEMGKLGVKSIMYAGEGEPFLHKHMADIVRHTKTSGIDVAITTNGVLFRKTLVEEILSDVEWIKVSINAGTGDTYAKIHGTKPSDFDKVIDNMSSAVKIKQDKGYKCTLGMQMLLLPENQHEVLLLTALAKRIGMDYLVIKPYSQHLMSKTEKYKNIKYDNYFHLSEELSKFNSEDFNVVFRINTMNKWNNGDRNYNRCLALPFWSYIDAGGDVWGCSAYIGDERFKYGNIYENSFQDIWEGGKRGESVEWVENELNPDQCRVNCRMDEINRYLWEMKHPPAHVNFI